MIKQLVLTATLCLVGIAGSPGYAVRLHVPAYTVPLTPSPAYAMNAALMSESESKCMVATK